jgi:hypothetical protein
VLEYGSIGNFQYSATPTLQLFEDEDENEDEDDSNACGYSPTGLHLVTSVATSSRFLALLGQCGVQISRLTAGRFDSAMEAHRRSQILMKKILIIAAALTVLPFASDAGQPADARMFCMSLRFHRGDGGPYGLDTLDLTTLPSGINNELGPLFGYSYSHWSWFEMTDFIFGDVYTGTLNLNTPPFVDANTNGFDDFYEVSQSVSGTSAGAYAFDMGGGGSMTAQWSRAAGASMGTCVLNFSTAGSFTHDFELLEYSGTLAYTPGSNTVSGTLNLALTDNPGETLQGPIAFVKSSTNRFNKLTLQPGFWTNVSFQTLAFTNHLFSRDSKYPTNYYGYVEYDDGDLNTFDPDYWLWVLSIDDLNDTDHDGIPDFSDDPATSLPRRPTLKLTPTSTNLWLTVSGDVGRLHQIQENPILSSNGWSTIISTVLTNDPQIFQLPPPNSAQKFWRATAQ